MFTALSLVMIFPPLGPGGSGASDSVAAGVPDAAPAHEPALIQDEEAEPMGVWKGSVNAGVLRAEGNTDLTSLSAGGDAQLRREKDRITLGSVLGTTRSRRSRAVRDPVSQRTAGANAKYDYFLDQRTYLFGAASAEYNKLADVDLRSTIGGGAGYQFIEREDLSLSAEAGLSYVSEDFGSSPDTEYLAARGAYDVAWQVNEDVEVLHTGTIFPSLEDSDDVYAKLDTRAPRDPDREHVRAAPVGLRLGQHARPGAGIATTTATSCRSAGASEAKRAALRKV